MGIIKMRLSFLLAVASALMIQKKGGDKYFATNEYDTDFAVEKQAGGYDVTPVDNFSSKEDAALPTPLDGEALVQEIDANSLNSELNEEDGAGIRDADDL